MRVPYGPLARTVDWLSAGRDAALDVDALVGGEAGTPRMALLNQSGLHQVEQEWLRYKASVADTLAQLVAARARRNGAAAALQRALAELDRVTEPSEEQLGTRLGGEERTAVGVIRDRRLAEHQRRCVAQTAQSQELRDELGRADVEVTRLTELVQHRFELAQAHAAAILSYAFHRRLAYLSRLLRRHPDGRQLGRSLRADVVGRPEWTIADRSPDLHDRGDR